jgi:hypothetical protein
MRRLLWYGNSSASDCNPNILDNPVCLSVYLSVCLSLYLSVCPFNCMAHTANTHGTCGSSKIAFCPLHTWQWLKWWLSRPFKDQRIVDLPECVAAPLNPCIMGAFYICSREEECIPTSDAYYYRCDDTSLELREGLAGLAGWGGAVNGNDTEAWRKTLLAYPGIKTFLKPIYYFILNHWEHKQLIQYLNPPSSAPNSSWWPMLN